MRVGVIIPAAGSGRRMRGADGGRPSDIPKQFLTLARVPILVRAIEPFTTVRAVQQIWVALPGAHRTFLDRFIRRYGWTGRVQTIVGRDTRQASVAAAFEPMDKTLDVILVHDGVRPFIEVSLIRRVIVAAHQTGAAIPAVPPTDTLKRVRQAPVISETVSRDEFYCAQTPQGFRTEILGDALAHAARDGFLGTDEASLVERLGHPVHIVPGSVWNFKITRPLDWVLAQSLVKRREKGEG